MARKPQFSYGWDWVDSLPNIGIWRGCGWKAARTPCFPRCGWTRCGWTAAFRSKWKPCWRTCILGANGFAFWNSKLRRPTAARRSERRYPLDAFPGRTPIRDVIDIPNAKLWWPNGLGEQPLYGVLAQVVDRAGAVYDRRQFAIGLRTIELDRSHLPDGSRFCVRVNGQDVFCHGGNLGPQDAILARISDAKYEKLVAEAKTANVNMFRINGCSIYEGPAFYDACDRAGILIFHDFMLTDTTYPDDDKVLPGGGRGSRGGRAAAAASSEHRALVREQRVLHGSSATGGIRTKASRWTVGGRKLYNQVLPDVCRHLDPRRPYMPGSPCGGDDPNSELSGDCHWW